MKWLATCLLLLAIPTIISAMSSKPIIKRKFSVDATTGKVTNRLWKNKVIPYTFKAGAYTRKYKKMVVEGLKEWGRQTCLKFVPKTTQSEVMEFVNEKGSLCSSTPGSMEGVGAIIQLESPMCISRATILHEVGHALGLEHEYLRPGRSKELKFSGPEKLEVKKANTLQEFGLPYDVQSVMGYSYQSLENYKPKFVHPNKKKFMDENRMEVQPLSFTDVAAINLMYKCGAHCSASRDFPCPKQGFLDQNCKCITPWGYAKQTCKNRLSRKKCEKKKRRLGCFTRYMGKNCRKSCGLCYVYFKNEWKNVRLTRPSKQSPSGSISRPSEPPAPAPEPEPTVSDNYGDSDTAAEDEELDELVNTVRVKCVNKKRTTQCESWARQGWCDDGDKSSFMYAKCRKTCNRKGFPWCNRPCMDAFSSRTCASFKAEGACVKSGTERSFYYEVAFNCFKTCNKRKCQANSKK